MDFSNTGLTSSQASEMLKKNGSNEIPEEKPSIFKKIIQKFVSPISLMLLAAAFLSLIDGKVFDFYFIFALLFMNLGISVIQEKKADDAIDKLNENLKSKVSVLRDNVWKEIDSTEIVKDDIIKLSIGEVIPADGIILNFKNLTINESALTGESLPKEKKINDSVFSGSFIETGQAVVKVTATGANTYFGKTIFSVEKTKKKSILETDIIRISKFLSILSFTGVFILTIVFLFQKVPVTELLTLDLSIIIAGIPVSLPTVMTLIISFGVLELAKKHAIVRRISALEDLANVNLLLTDKTGTLTKNKITVENIFSYESFTQKDVLSYAFTSTIVEEKSALDDAISERSLSEGIKKESYKIIDFIPADSVRKRSTVTFELNKEKFLISIGAPQIIKGLLKIKNDISEKFDKDVDDLALGGYRTLAVAISRNSKEKNMELVGLVALSDEIREDASSVIKFMADNNIDIAMVTGDNKAIATEVARKLKIPGKSILTKNDLEKLGWDNIGKEVYINTAAFAEILPDDKYQLVKHAKNYFVVATNGDGINDLPALKAANVGFAVKNAVSALRATADIVLLSEGISVIKDAVIEGRKIFARIYSYSVYRMSESLRLIVTIVILGVFYRAYPLTPLQIIIIALFNDIPIISLAFDRVKNTTRPSKIKVRKRFIISSVYGLVGVANSLILFLIMVNIMHLDWSTIQTMYFLKLTVSGHMLIYVARTKETWFKYLPSKQVIFATTITQIFATLLAVTGFFMPGKISIQLAILAWGWAFLWMQVSELAKVFQRMLENRQLSK